jgi:hypothetical protein
MRATRPGALLLVLIVGVAACSGGDDDDDGADLGTTSTIAPAAAPDLPAASPAGTGVVVIGDTNASFSVTECQLEPGEADGVTTPLVRVAGEGTTGTGVPFEVTVERSSTAGAAETFTDAITYSDTGRILQLQRVEVAGEVVDLRDPDARGTLVRVRPGGVSATGIAGPPGTVAAEDPGLVGLAVDATC